MSSFQVVDRGASTLTSASQLRHLPVLPHLLYKPLNPYPGKTGFLCGPGYSASSLLCSCGNYSYGRMDHGCVFCRGTCPRGRLQRVGGGDRVRVRDRVRDTVRLRVRVRVGVIHYVRGFSYNE